MIQCPFCSEEINKDEKVCPFCRGIVAEPSTNTPREQELKKKTSHALNLDGKPGGIGENETAVRFLLAGFLILILAVIAEGIYQKPILNDWQEITEPIVTKNFDLVYDKKSQDWVCGSEGVGVLNEGKWRVYNQENSGFPGECYSITIDSQDNIWVGTNAGLSVFHDGSWLTYTEENSPLLQNQICFVNADHLDRVWVVYCNVNRSGTIISSCANCITDIVSIYDGGEWTTLELGGLNIDQVVFDHRDTTWVLVDDYWDGDKVYTIQDGNIDPRGIPGQKIEELCADENGYLWVKTRNEYYADFLFSHDGDSWIQEKEISNASIAGNLACSGSRVAFGNHDNLWIIEDQSTFHYTPENSPIVWGGKNVHFDSEGRLWMGDCCQTQILTKVDKAPWPNWLIKIRLVTFHPESVIVFSLLFIGIAIAIWQGVVEVTATIAVIGLIVHSLSGVGLPLRFLFGGTHIILGMIGSLIGGEINRRRGKRTPLTIILAIVGIAIGLVIDIYMIFWFYM